MNNEQLNKLVISYHREPSEELFLKIYDLVTMRWKRDKIFYSLSKRYNIDITEVESAANILPYEIIGKYLGKGDFFNFLSAALSRRCIDIHRKTKAEMDSKISLDSSLTSEDDSDNPLLDYLVCANAEDEAIENLQKKSDQRQLIAQLIDKAPTKSREALKAYVESDFSYPEAAKLLNTSYPAVKRRVEKIATYFDANQNGSVYDYFTVITTA